MHRFYVDRLNKNNKEGVLFPDISHNSSGNVEVNKRITAQGNDSFFGNPDKIDMYNWDILNHMLQYENDHKPQQLHLNDSFMLDSYLSSEGLMDEPKKY